MANLPATPITGTVVSRYLGKPYAAFTTSDGKEVPAGQNSFLWLLVSADSDPIKVKNPPRLPEQGEVVTLLLRESFGRVVCEGEVEPAND